MTTSIELPVIVWVLGASPYSGDLGEDRLVEIPKMVSPKRGMGF
jgi:hypothetical protein